jgi:uncharacterized membrane protein YkvA (DUF1232 family)
MNLTAIHVRRASNGIPNGQSEAQRVQDMLSEGGGVVEPRVPVSEEANDDSNSEGVLEKLSAVAVIWLEDVARKWGTDHLRTLVSKKGRLSKTMEDVPENMHRMANQTRLVLELVDDVRDGTYREISWRSVALLVAGLLYTVNPADVVPDGLPLIGRLDELVLLAVLTRLVRNDLRTYCRFKGYPEGEYFVPGSRLA